ncbi:MAG: type 1 glutamine amidotransferase domain-containing protein [Acidimicrobiales bacterium]
MTKKALIVATNHSDFEHAKADPTGLWLSELTHFYDEFERAGIDIDIASPLGGKVPIDGRSLGRIVLDKATKRRHEDPEFMALLDNTRPLSDVDGENYDVLYFAGGHGAMWDFANNDELQTLVRQMYEAGRVVSAVCHGVAALQDVRLSNGEYLIAGKQGTGFAYFDERIGGVKRYVPYNLERRLKDRGMIYSKARLPLAGHTVVDDRLITGQNPNSATDTAQKTLEAIGVQGGHSVGSGRG